MDVMALLNKLVADVMATPSILLGLLVAFILLIFSADFRLVVLKLVDQAILAAESQLSALGQDKLNLAVDYVMNFLPQPYRSMLPRAMVTAMVQFVFNRKWNFTLNVEAKQPPLPPTMPQDEPPSAPPASNP